MRDIGDGEVSAFLLREGPPPENNLALVGDKAVGAVALYDKDGLRVNGH